MPDPDDKLTIWVVYDSPADHPGVYVARKFLWDAPTGSVITSRYLETIRYYLGDHLGLYCIPRDPSDDPVIVECWL